MVDAIAHAWWRLSTLRWPFLVAVLFTLVGPGMAGVPAPARAFPAPDGLRWDIQLSAIELDPVPDVDVVELDGDEARAEDVAALHAAGITAICYINAGAWEDWRSDAGRYPEGILGNAYPGWPGERFVDIRAIDTLGPILEARLDTCVEKGFDAVDPDNVDTWQADTGFDLTGIDQLRFNRWLAAAAHERGLAIGQKNAPDLAAALVEAFDFAVTEDCLVDGWCHEMQPYADAGKPVLMIEYTDRAMDNDEICGLAAGTFGAVVIKHRELDAWSAHCR